MTKYMGGEVDEGADTANIPDKVAAVRRTSKVLNASLFRGAIKAYLPKRY